MKLISWNVNGLRACAGKGFFESVASLNADVAIKVSRNAGYSLEELHD